MVPHDSLCRYEWTRGPRGEGQRGAHAIARSKILSEILELLARSATRSMAVGRLYPSSGFIRLHTGAASSAGTLSAKPFPSPRVALVRTSSDCGRSRCRYASSMPLGVPARPPTTTMPFRTDHSGWGEQDADAGLRPRALQPPGGHDRRYSVPSVAELEIRSIPLPENVMLLAPLGTRLESGLLNQRGLMRQRLRNRHNPIHEIPALWRVVHVYDQVGRLLQPCANISYRSAVPIRDYVSDAGR